MNRLFGRIILLFSLVMMSTPAVLAISSVEDCNVCCSQSPSKQPKKHRNDKKLTFEEINNFKIDFLVKEMELTGETRQKFEKLYRERNKELHQYFSRSFQIERKLKGDKNLTEDDYAEAIKTMNESRAKCMEIEKNFDKKFEKFLTKKQLYKMREGERKFHETMRKMPKGKGKPKK